MNEPWNEEPTIWKAFTEHWYNERVSEEAARKNHDKPYFFNKYHLFRAGFMAGGNN